VQTASEPWTSRRPLLAGVSSFGLGGTNSHVVVGERARKVVFVCPGQGAQWGGMARDVLDAEPVFRAVIERCDQLIARTSGWSLLDVLRADPQDARLDARLDRIEVSLPAIISIDIAL